MLGDPIRVNILNNLRFWQSLHNNEDFLNLIADKLVRLNTYENDPEIVAKYFQDTKGFDHNFLEDLKDNLHLSNFNDDPNYDIEKVKLALEISKKHPIKSVDIEI